MSVYDEQAQRYLILVEGGPPSNSSAWSPDLPGWVGRAQPSRKSSGRCARRSPSTSRGSPRRASRSRSLWAPGLYVERKPAAVG
jgi:hypothetical protein